MAANQCPDPDCGATLFVNQMDHGPRCTLAAELDRQIADDLEFFWRRPDQEYRFRYLADEEEREMALLGVRAVGKVKVIRTGRSTVRREFRCVELEQ